MLMKAAFRRIIPLGILGGVIIAVLGSGPSTVAQDDSGAIIQKENDKIVFIPPSFLNLYPFSFRFVPGSDSPGHHLIDLKTARFITDGLETRSEDGHRAFLDPDLSTFASDLLEGPIASGKDLYLILQAGSPSDQVSLRDWLEHSGIPILDYIPQDAYLVRIDGSKAKALFQRPEIYWAGPFHPAYRIDPKLDYLIETSPGHEVMMRAVFDGASCPGEEEFQASLYACGAAIYDLTRTESGFIVTLEGPAEAARALVRLPGCLWVERYVQPKPDNNIARTSANVATGRGSVSGPIMDVEDVWARGIHGEGQIASAADTGLSTGNLATLHQDFGNQSDANNPMRVIKGYALGRTATWDDNQTTGGGHGTHTSGSIVGNGFRSGSTPSSNTFPSTCYAGIAPKAQFVFQSVMDSSGNLGGLPADLNNLFQPPYTDGARVHSNSWGAAVAGDYTTDSQNVDKFCWLNKDMVITFSAGNSGVDCWYYTTSCQHPSGCSPDGVIDADSIGAPGTAKNCITVGASEDYRPGWQYEYPQGTCNTATWGWFNGCSYSVTPVNGDPMADNANGMAAFSSRGPTNDGRIKPDIVAPGTAIISTRTDMNQAYEQWGVCAIPGAYQSYYMTMGGTSMANPLTAGSAVLVRQYYKDGWHANNSLTTNGSPVPSDGFNPSSALVKATLINGAWDMAPGQYGTGSTKEIPPGWDTGHDLPNNAEGYGRVDLEHSLFPGSGWGDDASRKLEVHDISPGLSTGQSDTYTFGVTSSANPLIATLVWTDPYGATSAGTELVNNLDLTVTAPDSTVYYPNGLNKTSGADTKNNVEQVKLTSPTAGTYTIRISGTAVPGNGQSGTTTQPYALVISGVSGCAGNPSSVSVSPSGPLTLCLGASQALTANLVGGTGPFSYQWTEDSADIPGANGSSFLASATGTHSYNCKVTGSGCSTPALDVSPTQISWQSAPTFAGLTSVLNPAGSTCTLNLSWSAATPNCGSSVYYNIYRSTNPGFVPSAASRIATGVTANSFSDTAGLVYGTIYYYVVRAVDLSNGSEDGNTLILPGSPMGTDVTQTLFSDTFESGSGLNGWQAGCFGAACSTTECRGIMTCQAYSGSKIFRWGGNSCTSDYGNSKNSFVSPGGSSGITVPAAATQVRLSFWHQWQFESGKDGAMMRLSTDGANYYYIPSAATGVWIQGGYTGTVPYGTGTRDMWTGASPGYPGTYQETVMDLDAACNYIFGGSAGAAGKTLFIAFGGYSDTTGAYDGWFLDDVAITYMAPGPCSPAGSTSSVKPVPDGSWITGAPMLANKVAADGSTAALTWDVSSCPDTNYNLYWGNGSDLSAYTLQNGGLCSLGTSGSVSPLALPAIPSGQTFIWWVLAGTDGVSMESSWGKDSSGNERHPAASGQCGFTAKSTASTCP